MRMGPPTNETQSAKREIASELLRRPNGRTRISSTKSISYCRHKSVVTHSSSLTLRLLQFHIILLNILLLPLVQSVLSNGQQLQAPNGHQYISDRLCNKIYTKLQTRYGNLSSLGSTASLQLQQAPPGPVAPPQTSFSPLIAPNLNSSQPQHNDTLAYLNQRDGAKYPFWIQCFASYESGTGAGGGGGVSGVGGVGGNSSSRMQNSYLTTLPGGGGVEDNDSQLSDLSTIFDAWTSSDDNTGSVGSNDDNSPSQFNGKRRLLPAPIQDDRYDYLVSVTNHCRINSNVKLCNYFKIGLSIQQADFPSSTSSSSSSWSLASNITATTAATTTATTTVMIAPGGNLQQVAPLIQTRCPVCGLNDLNCDNVNQCTSDCGQIKSINYPLNYGNNHRCRWSIRAPNGFYVNLSIIDFDIPSANNASKLGTCIFDYLTLIDGYTGKRIGCYCNENLPPANIVSPWNELIIQFDTNSETTGRGFYFEYKFMKLELNERIRSQLASGHVCLQGWQYFRGSCYRAYNDIEPLQWYDAENKCNYLGEGLDGHLVSILDKDEMLVILHWLTNVWNSTRYREYYIGLIDVSREGLYRWSDNNPMSYTDWELKPMLLEDETPAQPDGGAYEDCTVIRYTSFSRTSNWHDVPCSLGKHYHSRLEKGGASIKFKWDYVSSYICKIDSISVAPSMALASSLQQRSKIRRPLFSNEFKPSLQADHLISHLSGSTNQRNSNLIQWSSDKLLASSTASATLTTTAASTPVGQTMQASGSNSTATATTTSTTTTTTTTTTTVAPSLSSSKLAAQISAATPLADNSSSAPNSQLQIDQQQHQQQQQQQQLVRLTTSGSSSTSADQEVAAAAEAQKKALGKQTSLFYLSKLDDNRYFICDNLEVISTVLRCDGVAHCRDGSDESNGCDQDCLDWQFKCANGRCISIGYYCDFSDDCGDGSDESRCERHRCKLNEFRCQSGQCIAAQQRCDLLPDCRDSSDEGRSCTIGSNCNSASTFQCYNGLCIPQYAVCDFQIDCPGKFHEDEDATTCELLQKNQGPNYAPIRGTGTSGGSLVTLGTANVTNLLETSQQLQGPQAIASSNVSSVGGVGGGGELAAGRGLLQVSATQTQVSARVATSEVVFYPANRAASVDTLADNLFRCKSGNTIDANQRCLFEFDKYGYQLGCRDVSHLNDCTDFVCPQRDYVKCSNSYCIPWRYVCDGKWDCIMGDDEVGCARYVCPGQYKCANQSSCILLHQLCDGHRQCPMGDDEWFCDLQCPLGCDCIGQSVSCRGANLTSLPSNYIPKAVRKLDLSYNRLGPNLSSGNFDAYHDLGELILSHNEIEVLTPRKFHQLRNLYKLDLSYNRIHSVKRGAFAGLRRVTQLLLESNQQLFLLEPEAFLGLSSLQMLNISSSRIQSLKRNTFDGLTSLRHLLLRSNMILTVEDGAFRSLSSLVSLDMRGNDIKHFTKLVFSDLKSLRNLSTDSFKFCCLMNQQIPADKCLPAADEISDCEDLLSSVPQRTCIWIAGAFACVGNLIVIIWRYRDRLGQKERENQQVNSTLLLSLGFSDLLMGIYLIIIAFVDSWYRGRYIENADKWRESLLCNLCGFLSTISSTVSVLTLVFIAYNRYLEICSPFKVASKFTLGYTHRLIRSSWLLALTIATLPLIVWPYFKGQFYAKSGVCLAFHITDQRTAGWLYSILVSPCINLASFSIIFMCYMRIYGETSRAARRKIVLTILTHFVAFSPPMILGFMSLAHYTPPAALYSWIAVLVLPVNSAIDPMIYTIPNIRDTIQLLIRSYRMRKSGALSAAARAQQSQQQLLASSTSAASTMSATTGGGQTTTLQTATGTTALAATAAATATNGQQLLMATSQFQLEQAKELVPMLRTDVNLWRALSKRNVPPGYVPVSQFISQQEHLYVGHLVEIALEIARDLEDKHRDAKVYVSLRLEDIFVSNSVIVHKQRKSTSCSGAGAGAGAGGGQDSDSLGLDRIRTNRDKRISTTVQPVASAASRQPKTKLAIFLADHDGYRHKRSQPCGHVGVSSSQLPPASQGQNLMPFNGAAAAAAAAAANGHYESRHHHHNHHHHRHLHKSVLNCECSDVARFGDILFKLIQLFNSRKLERTNTCQSIEKLTSSVRK